MKKPDQYFDWDTEKEEILSYYEERIALLETLFEREKEYNALRTIIAMLSSFTLGLLLNPLV